MGNHKKYLKYHVVTSITSECIENGIYVAIDKKQLHVLISFMRKQDILNWCVPSDHTDFYQGLYHILPIYIMERMNRGYFGRIDTREFRHLIIRYNGTLIRWSLFVNKDEAYLYQK
jgi:hypothetical protein